MRVLAGLLFLFSFASPALAQQSIESIRQNAVRIESSDRGLVRFRAPGLVRGQHALIVRIVEDDDDYEAIADGRIEKVDGDVGTIRLDFNQLKKLPETTDFVVPLGPPKEFKPAGPPPKPNPPDFDTSAPETPEPGYIEIGYEQITTNLQTTASDGRTNAYKNIPSLKHSGFSLEWFLEFLSNYGIFYGQSAGSVPITSYYREGVDAQSTETIIRLMYRTKKHGSFRFRGILGTKILDFHTNNPDEAILSTKVPTTSFGGEIDYEPGDLLLTGKKARFQLTSLKLQALMSLAGSAQDGANASRGTGAVSETEFRVGVVGTTYLPWVPWVHRYFLSVESFMRQRKFTFSGSTNDDLFYRIPEGMQSSETEHGLVITLGVRFEDMVGRVLRPR